MERRLGRSPLRLPIVRVLFASTLALAAVACRGPAPTDIVGSQAGGGQDWYCEPAGEGGWQCIPNVVQTTPPAAPALAEAPAPAEPTPPVPVQEPAPPVPAEPAPPVATQPVAPPPAAPPAVAGNLPLYVQLAHRLDGTPLLELPSDFFAVQLFAALTRAKVEEVAVDSGLESMAGARVERDGKIFFVLLAGVYADRERAERAANSLPPNIRALRPWVRSLGGLQASMRRADALAAEQR